MPTIQDMCPREATVQSILDSLLTYRVLHLRGTPCSGKTVLMELIIDYIRRKMDKFRTVFVRSWPTDINGENETESYLETILGIPAKRFAASTDLVLLIDEAQTTYRNTYLWNTLIKDVDKRRLGVFIILLSSYRSASGFSVKVEGLTPIILHPAQRIGLQPSSTSVGLLLTSEDADDVMERFRRTNPDSPVYTPDLKEGLYVLAGGHVGGLMALLLILHTNTVSTVWLALHHPFRDWQWVTLLVLY